MSILPSYLSSTIQAQKATAVVIEMPKEYDVDFETGQLTGRIVGSVEALKDLDMVLLAYAAFPVPDIFLGLWGRSGAVCGPDTDR